jgi:DNA-binding MarR family transcriptional regulator
MIINLHPVPGACNCLAVRQAARHITQLYDHFLVPVGLRTTQYSILATLQSKGPMTINALAQALVMDRTTLGRNILPLQRQRLVSIAKGSVDRRSKELRLTDTGVERLRAGAKCWSKAQARFDDAFGSGRAVDLRALLWAVVSTDFAAAPSVAS